MSIVTDSDRCIRYTQAVPFPFIKHRPPAPWQRQPAAQLLAVLLSVGLMYLLLIAGGFAALSQTVPLEPTVTDALFQLFFLVGIFGTLTFLCLWFLCGEGLSALNLQQGDMQRDILDGIGLAFILGLSQVAYTVIAGYFTGDIDSSANIEIAEALAADPLLLLLWLGPLVWIQAAFFEEFTRTFMLSRLFRVWPGKLGNYMVVLGSALLFGLAHLYQGPLGVLGTAIIGLVLGVYYIKRGRFLPMMIAHGLYDTAVILLLVWAVKSGSLA